jgi:hypothetical protein
MLELADAVTDSNSEAEARIEGDADAAAEGLLLPLRLTSAGTETDAVKEAEALPLASSAIGEPLPDIDADGEADRVAGEDVQAPLPPGPSDADERDGNAAAAGVGSILPNDVADDPDGLLDCEPDADGDAEVVTVG